MSPKHDDFFKNSASTELTQKILKSAQVELGHNRQRQKSKFWFLFLGPVLAAVAASFFMFKLNISQNVKNVPQTLSGLAVTENVGEEVIDSPEHLELASDFADDLEDVEMVDELGLLQEFDEIELITDEELEG